MLDFVRKYFKKSFAVLLWVVLAVCVISGVIIGWYIANVFGLMVGIVAAVLFGGAGLFVGLFSLFLGAAWFPCF